MELERRGHLDHARREGPARPASPSRRRPSPVPRPRASPPRRPRGDRRPRWGVSERTLFRTFGTKAAIFWCDAFLSRVVRALAPDPDPVAALRESGAHGHRHDHRRAVGAGARPPRGDRRGAPDLIATGTQELNSRCRADRHDTSPDRWPRSPQAVDLVALRPLRGGGHGRGPSTRRRRASGARNWKIAHKAARRAGAVMNLIRRTRTALAGLDHDEAEWARRARRTRVPSRGHTEDVHAAARHVRRGHRRSCAGAGRGCPAGHRDGRRWSAT